MKREELLAMWHFEEEFPFYGWDFSHLDGRWASEELPWDYEEEVLARLDWRHRLLDIETGDGYRLLSLRHPYENTCVTESYPPHMEICMNELAPLGITVRPCDPAQEPLPYEDDSFDIVINRHGSYMADEVRRVLKPGGLFITEQVGCLNNLQLSRRLLTDYMPEFPMHNLHHECARFDALNMEIVEARESFPRLRFFDIGALVYYAMRITWEFPGFSVNRCEEELLNLHSEIAERGCVDSLEHRFFMAVRKPDLG